MAEVLPFKALHYDLGKVGSLDAVAAPPYDVIDAPQRRALLERSPYNAVAIDLPKPFDPADPDSDPSGDPYAEAAARIESWRADGALVQDDEPSLWALTQDYVAPDGNGYSRNGILARVRVEDYESGTVRPHERTHPGPLLDRLELTRATRLQPLADLLALDRGRLAAGRAVPARTSPGARRRTKAAPSTGSGRSRTRPSTPPSPSAWRPPSC